MPVRTYALPRAPSTLRLPAPWVTGDFSATLLATVTWPVGGLAVEGQNRFRMRRNEFGSSRESQSEKIRTEKS